MASNPITFEIVMGDRVDTHFLYVFEEQQLYTKHSVCKEGTKYRCANRKCPSKLIKKSDTECVKPLNAKPHNHTDSLEKIFFNLKAKQTMKNEALDLHSVAGGSRITKSREIYKKAMLQ